MSAKPRQTRATVTAVRKLTPTVFELDFVSQESIPYIAGQYISIVIPNSDPSGRPLRRAYSLASHPSESALKLCVKVVENGPGTTFLQNLKVSDQFDFWAAYGSFVWNSPPSVPICFVSTGTGIAPFRAILVHPPSVAPSLCILGVRTTDEILYADFFSKIPHMSFVPCISGHTPENYFAGRVTHYLAQNTMDPTTHFYLCGAGEMIKEVRTILTNKGFAPSQVHYEKYY
jgi:ferredoxin-NADP reductase